MQNEITVRKAGRRDVDAVFGLDCACFAHPWTRPMFHSDIVENKITEYFVASVDGTDAGYGGMWIIVDEAHVTNICTHPDFRHLGVASAILAEMMKAAVKKKVGSMTLEVRVSNVRAMKLYEKFGFHIAGKRKKYYSDNGEDAYVLWNENIKETVNA